MQPKWIATFVVLMLTGSAVAQDVVPAHTRPRLFWWALPSDTGNSIGYHVGGGSSNPRKAEPRRDDEGTWGWDYQGWLLPRRVANGWWHGRRAQGGTGAYRTEGAQIHKE